MPSLVRALFKTLSTAIGPLGAPIEGGISLYEDYQLDKIHKEILKLITDSKRDVVKTVEKLLETINERPVSYNHTRISFIGILTQLHIDEKLRNELLDTVKNPSHTDQDLANIIYKVVQKIQGHLESKGFLSEKLLHKELLDYFPNTSLFIPVVAFIPEIAAGLSRGYPPIQMYWEFIEICRGLDYPERQQAFSELSNQKPVSKVFKAWADLYDEIEA